MARAALSLATAALYMVLPVAGPSASEPDTNDVRREIRLSPSEHDAIRAEMRTLLRSLGAVVQGLVGNDLLMVERAARAAGTASALGPEIARGLPPEFVQLDARLHRRFEQIAEAARAGKSADLLKRVASVTGFCVTCHDTYRVERAR